LKSENYVQYKFSHIVHVYWNIFEKSFSTEIFAVTELF